MGLGAVAKRLRYLSTVALLALTPRRSCAGVTRLGSGYGGWWLPLDLVDESSVCYLAGVGTDISFDTELIARTGARAWGIDPTPRAKAWVEEQQVDERWSLVPVGLGGASGQMRFFEPADPGHSSYSAKNLQRTTEYVMCDVLTVGDLMSRLGHSALDVLKLDIEGAEHDTLRTMLEEGIRPPVLCVEFDQPEPLRWTISTLWRLHRSGYRVAKVERLNFLLLHEQARTRLTRGPRHVS